MDDTRATLPAHTPGPWVVFGVKTDAPIIHTAEEGPIGVTVAVIAKEWTTEREKETNANLIAAAPKLLRKCKEYSRDCTTRIEGIQEEEGQYCFCNDKDDHDRHCDAGEQIGHWRATKRMVDAVIDEAEGRLR